jgi:hypothetical protein
MSEKAADKDTICLSPHLKFGQARVDSRTAKARSNEHPLQAPLFGNGAAQRSKLRKPSLSTEDNTPEGLQALLKANRYYREVVWPAPYHRTNHILHLGDAKGGNILDSSDHLAREGA